MSDQVREATLVDALVELADTLVSDFDVVELSHRLVIHCVGLLSVDAAGLLLSDQRGSLEVFAASDEGSRLLELFQLQNDEGPCLDAFRSGVHVAAEDLHAMIDVWPRFVAAAEKSGFRSVHAFPLRLRDDVIGALNLFGREVGPLTVVDARVAQALADIATIGILQERAIHHGEIVVEQLQGALYSRVVVEQAKGLLSEAGGFDMNTAFQRLRDFARSNRVRLVEVAADLVEGRRQAVDVIPAPLA